MYLYFNHKQVAFVQSDLSQDTIKPLLYATEAKVKAYSPKLPGATIRAELWRVSKEGYKEERESRDERGGDKRYAVENRISQMS